MTPSRVPQLGENQIHVWSVQTDATEEVVGRLEPLLASAEIERANRFRFDELRRAFIVRRAARRLLLADYLRVPHDGADFEHAPNGKPSLAGSQGLDFNVSRSRGIAVFAFARHCEIGVDVEQIRPIPEKASIAGRFFCAEEAAELLSLPSEMQDYAFHLCWTRKEAYLKATGEGLSAPLDAFRVTLRPGEPAKFLHILHQPELAKSWSLHDLRVAPGYAAALAYQSAEREVVVFPSVQSAALMEWL